VVFVTVPSLFCSTNWSWLVARARYTGPTNIIIHRSDEPTDCEVKAVKLFKMSAIEFVHRTTERHLISVSSAVSFPVSPVKQKSLSALYLFVRLSAIVIALVRNTNH